MDLLELQILKRNTKGQTEFTLGTLFSILSYLLHLFLGIIELSITALIFLSKLLVKLITLAYQKVQVQLN